VRALVTGGFGFIGGHLVEALLRSGRQVHVVDNLSSNPVPAGQLLDDLGHPEGLTFDIQDIAYGQHNRRRYDEIYHLASPVGPAGVIPHAGQMVRQIVDDAYTLIKLAQQNDAVLVDVSTSEVYGGGEGGLCREDMPRKLVAQTTPRLEYAVAKLAAETAILNTSGLRAVIVRPFNVAGPRQSSAGGFVVPRFIEQALSGEALTVFGDGQQQRAFTHVREIAEGLVQAAERGQTGTVYNLGNPANRIRVVELAVMVMKIVGQGHMHFVDPQTIFGPRYAEAADKYPDSSRALRDLGWQPVAGVEQVVRDALRYREVGYANDRAADR